MESNLDDPGGPDVTTRVPMGEAGGQRAEKPRKKGARCQSSAAASWPLPSTSEAAEACESLPSPGSLGTCFTYVPFKATGDLRQLEHNQTSENKKHGHEDAIPRQNITA